MAKLRGRPDRVPENLPAPSNRLAANPSPNRPTLSLRRKLVFAVSSVLGIFVLLELALWACGVKPANARRDPFAGFTPQVSHFQVEVDATGQEVVTLVPNKRESLNDQRFPMHKPPDTFRIVCLGGSATYGRPFFDHTSFAGWLRAFLPRADRTRKWEVINAGAISYASYRIKGLMSELDRYVPDMFIVYTGENEFLERRTYASVFETPGLLRNAAGLASRLRIATVTQRGLELAGLLRPIETIRSTGLHEEVVRIPVYAVGPEAYTRDETFKREVLSHYEASLNAMVDLAAETNARLLFVTPISNLRDFAPFKSENRSGLTADQLRAWRVAYEKGQKLAQSNQAAEADRQFDAALAIDDRHADLLYRKGQALLALGKDKEARDYLVRARDEDICPLRALTVTLDTMRKVAAQRGVELLDFERLATPRASHQIPGEDLLADHVHLQIAGSKMLALDILDQLAREKIVSLSPEWGTEAIASVTAQVEAGIEGPRYAHELYSLSQLLDALGQTEQALKRVEEGLELSKGDADGLCLAGRYSRKLGRLQVAADFFQKALVRQPGAACAEEGLGGLLLDQGNLPSALEHLSAAARAAPESPSVANLLGVAHARLGHHDQAVSLFRRASQLLPTDPAILANLALAEEQRGNLREAVLHYQESLRLKPDNPQASAGLKRLMAAKAGPASGK